MCQANICQMEIIITYERIITDSHVFMIDLINDRPDGTAYFREAAGENAALPTGIGESRHFRSRPRSYISPGRTFRASVAYPRRPWDYSRDSRDFRAEAWQPRSNRGTTLFFELLILPRQGGIYLFVKVAAFPLPLCRLSSGAPALRHRHSMINRKSFASEILRNMKAFPLGRARFSEGRGYIGFRNSYAASLVGVATPRCCNCDPPARNFDATEARSFREE